MQAFQKHKRWTQSRTSKHSAMFTFKKWAISQRFCRLACLRVIPLKAPSQLDTRAGGGAPALESQLSTLATSGFRVRISLEADNRLSCPRSADKALTP